MWFDLIMNVFQLSMMATHIYPQNYSLSALTPVCCLLLKIYSLCALNQNAIKRSATGF